MHYSDKYSGHKKEGRTPMNFLGYPIEIWAAAIIAVFVKLQASNTLTLFGAITTVVIALLSGVFLYTPIAAILSLGTSWHIPLAIIIALSAENLMKAIVELSADKEWLKDWIIFMVDRDKIPRRSNDTDSQTNYPNDNGET